MENAMNIVLGTTVLILLILLIRGLFWKKCNPNILYFLWFFVAMRILLPVHIPLVLQNSLLSESILHNTSVYSYESLEHNGEVTERNELSDDEASNQPNELLDDTVLGGANVVSNNSSLPEMEDNTDKPAADTSKSDSGEVTIPKAKPIIKPGTVFAIIWCLGSILMALYFILVNIYAFRNIEKRKVGSLQDKIDIYETTGYNCLVGIFRPQIFLDSRILNNSQHKKFVLLHEMEHYKAKDNFWLIIRNLCLIVQWFNPFVWIAYFKVQEDCELACDYRVLSGLSKLEKESYAETLLYILESKQKRAAFASSAGNWKAVIKKRLQCVFEQRKTKWFLMLFLLMGIVTVTTFLKVTVNGKSGDNTQVGTNGTDKEATAQDNFKDNAKDNTNVIFVENMEDVERGRDLDYSNCYTTDIKRVNNHYWIDENGTLWGTGPSDCGQLGELRDDLTMIIGPKEIAGNVKHVDFSGEYFMIYLTYDNKLYGLGGNPAGILQESSREEFNSTYMNVIAEPVLLMEDVVFAKCGYSTIIALKDNGDVYVMGNNYYTAFFEESYYEPEKVMENAKYVTSYFHTFAVICDDNSLWTWGDNCMGQCGIGSFSENEEKPQKVMDDVDCAWMGKVAFNSGNEISELDNLIVLKKDGSYYGCGIGVGTEMMHNRTDDFDEEHLYMTKKVAASYAFQEVTIQEYEKVSLKPVGLFWSEDDLIQFLNNNNIDYSVEYTDDTNLLIYLANENKWEFIFNDKKELAMIASTVSDEFEKDILAVGDPLQKVKEEYGDDYEKYEGEYDYFTIKYDMDGYDFQIGIYNNLGCARFSKCIKGFSLLLEKEAKNNLYQKTKLVMKDMEIRELSEEEIGKLVQLRQKLFAGLSEEEITEITEKLWGAHGGLEADIVYYDFGTLTDSNSERWQWFDDTTPNDYVDNGHWAPEVIQELEDVKEKLSDTRVINLITEAQNEIQAIVDERSNVHVMKAHTILHDLDYWLFRYPPEGFEDAPADWAGINIYYGELDEILEDSGTME